MNCEHARLLIGADPYATSLELEDHLQSCPACSEFRAEMVALEGNIRHALERSALGAETQIREAASAAKGAGVDAGAEPRVGAGAQAGAEPQVGAAAHPVVSARVRRAIWRGWALAASVLIAVTATLLVWFARPTDSLAHDIAAHVSGEPLSWSRTTPVDSAYLERVLRNGGVDSKVTSNKVVYAQTCLFHGHFVPHLVIQTASGPVTVMILPNEHVVRRRSFYEDGFAGVIVPAQHGSIAVLARGTANIDDIARQMGAARQTVAAQTAAGN